MTEKIERFGICFSAPSGAGKNVIINELRKDLTILQYLVSATTRKKRGDEIHGVDYYFIEVADFKQKVANNEFIEYEEVYKSILYGTLYSEIDTAIKNKNCPIFEIDVMGAKKLKEKLGENMLSILIIPESVDQLKKQVLGRESNIDPKILQERLEKAPFEIDFGKTFADFVVTNKYGELEKTVSTIKEICTNFLKNKNLWVPH